ncbi:MAG: UTP--glucose-1-phosphate uridylyltransferase GalU [Acidobacteria bacterium]|nr:UTP--glucose-1-phosphate uridylyltransferase GalU [Acidobacteriota bacterium]
MKVRKAVFPAAGLGTRFLPATKAQPKEMLPLVDKPIIQYVVEEAAQSGLDNIILVTGRGKNAIEDHFDVSYELEAILSSRNKLDLLRQVQQISEMIHVAYVRQKEALGLGHAVLMAKALVGEEPFAVLLGDDIIDAPVPCMKQMMEQYQATGASILAVMEVEPEAAGRYGIIEVQEDPNNGGRLFRIRDMIEKPSPQEAPSRLAVIGRYILNPSIFRALERTKPGAGGEIQLTDGIRLLMESEPVYAFRFHGKRFDAGDKLEFLKATVEFALKRGDLGPPFREYLRGLACLNEVRQVNEPDPS